MRINTLGKVTFWLDSDLTFAEYTTGKAGPSWIKVCRTVHMIHPGSKSATISAGPELGNRMLKVRTRINSEENGRFTIHIQSDLMSSLSS